MIFYEGFGFDCYGDECGVKAFYQGEDIGAVRPLSFLLAGLDHCWRGRKFEPRQYDGLWMRCSQRDKLLYFGLSLGGEDWDWLDTVEALELRLALNKFFNLLRPQPRNR